MNVSHLNNGHKTKFPNSGITHKRSGSSSFPPCVTQATSQQIPQHDPSHAAKGFRDKNAQA